MAISWTASLIDDFEQRLGENHCETLKFKFVSVLVIPIKRSVTVEHYVW